MKYIVRTVIVLLFFTAQMHADCNCEVPPFSALKNTTSDQFTRQLIVDTYATLTCLCECACLRFLPDPFVLDETPPVKSYRSSALETEVLAVPQNRILIENIETNISITADNVTLDLNGFEVYGCIDVSGSNCIIKNGFVTAPKPADGVEASIAAIRVTGNNNRIFDVVVECDASDDGIQGRAAVNNFGGETFIVKNCTLKGGDTTSAAAGIGLTAPGLPGVIQRIENCLIRGGSTDVDALVNGDGIIISGAFILDTTVDSGFPGSRAIFGNANTITGCTLRTAQGSAVGSSGGTGIDGDDNSISSCWITTGSGGLPDTVGSGGVGILGDRNLVRDCVIRTGHGVNGGVAVQGSDSTVQDSEIFTGNALGVSGLGGIGVLGGNLALYNLIIKTGLGLAAGSSGGTGIQIVDGVSTTLQQSIIFTGPGEQDGVGIIVDGETDPVENTIIQNCIIATGLVDTGASTTYGILIANARNTFVDHTRLTVNAGSDSVGVLVDTPADLTYLSELSISGGMVNDYSGIRTVLGSTNTQVLNCSINFCGQDGIEDNSSIAPRTSKIYRNLVFDVTGTNYKIENAGTVATEPGVSVYAPVIGEYENAFVPNV